MPETAQVESMLQSVFEQLEMLDVLNSFGFQENSTYQRHPLQSLPCVPPKNGIRNFLVWQGWGRGETSMSYFVQKDIPGFY